MDVDAALRPIDAVQSVLAAKLAFVKANAHQTPAPAQLLAFLRDYLPRRHDPPSVPLVGYGIDVWFCQALLGITESNGACVHTDRAAVIDAVPFVNPPTEAKPHGREIDRLQSWTNRMEAWEALAKRRGLVPWYPMCTFRRVPAERET